MVILYYYVGPTLPCYYNTIINVMVLLAIIPKTGLSVRYYYSGPTLNLSPLYFTSLHD